MNRDISIRFATQQTHKKGRQKAGLLAQFSEISNNQGT